MALSLLVGYSANRRGKGWGGIYRGGYMKLGTVLGWFWQDVRVTKLQISPLWIYSRSRDVWLERHCGHKTVAGHKTMAGHKTVAGH